METATRGAEELQGTRLPPVSPSVHGVVISCYRCGNSDHSANTCRFKSETCRRCGMQGHIQRVCRSKPKSPSPPGQPSKRVNPKKSKQRGIHAVQSASDSDSEDFDDVLGNIEIHSIKNSKSNVIWITPEVDGKPLKMELDTVSAVSVLPFSQYQKLYPNVKFKNSTTLLQTYTDEKIKPNGKTQVTVKHNGQTQLLEIYIVKSSGPPLLGRDWLEKICLDWRSIKNIAVLQDKRNKTTPGLKELLGKYKDVFNEEIETLNEEIETRY